MVEIRTLFLLQGQLFLLLLLGAVFRRKVADAAFQKGLTDLLIDLILPCNILASFQTAFDQEVFIRSVTIFGISLGIQLGCWLLAVVLYRRQPPERRAVLQYGTICSNAGFLGMPVAEGLFGADGILLTSIYLIPQCIFMWTVGVSFFAKSGQRKQLVRQLLMNPCVLAVLMGGLLLGTGARLPSLLDRTVQSVSKCCTAMSMLLIGMVIANTRWKQFLDPALWYYSAVRLFLIPAVTLLLCRLLHMEALATSVSLILVSMPAAGTTAVLASKYGADTDFSADCVAVSTALSVAAIPFWCVML